MNRAFPNDEVFPTLLITRRQIELIAIAIALDLLFPSWRTAFRRIVDVAVVPMPKTPIDEYDGLVLWKDKVWSARKL